MGGGGEAGGGDGVSGRGGEMVVVTASVAEAMAEAATAWAEQMLWAREVAATVVVAMVEAVTAWAAAGCILTASMLAEATEEAERARVGRGRWWQRRRHRVGGDGEGGSGRRRRRSRSSLRRTCRVRTSGAMTASMALMAAASEHALLLCCVGGSAARAEWLRGTGARTPTGRWASAGLLLHG